MSREDHYEKIVAMKPVKVMTVMNTVEAGIVLNLLRNNGIPCIKKDNFMGSYMNIYMGFSVYGAGIYVDEGDYEKALDILSVLSPDEGSGLAESEEVPEYETEDGAGRLSEDESEEESGDEDSLDHVPFYKKPYIVARIILGVMLASLILGAILSNINK